MGSLYIVASIALFLYSYTQVDLSLTLSRNSIFQTIEKSFQFVGYYQRPLSTGIFVSIALVFFVMYFFAIRRRHLSLWKIIIPMTVILVFSYPAFSYDIFNYMFDAKTVLVYHKIPYTVIPLQFSGVEPWLSFMHWTHIPSTFMPFWILLSLPAYLMGFGYFLGILWSFKILMAGAYLITTWYIQKILRVLDPNHATIGAAMFALNPLVIVESLVSGHYDIVMMAFAVAAFYYYLQHKRLSSFVLLAMSAATKIMTVSLVPLFLLGWQRVLSPIIMLLGSAAFILITGREIQPWYLLWILPWCALLPKNKTFFVLGTAASFGYLLSYAPFLYFGEYNHTQQYVKLIIILLPTLTSLVVAGSNKLKLLK